MSDGWQEHRLLVMSKLEKIEETTENTLKALHDQDKRLHGVEIKSGFMGLIGGFIAGFFK